MDDHEDQEKHGSLISPAYCYGDFSPSDNPAGMQSFEPSSHELISLQAGMEMLGIPSKHHQNTDTWRGFFPPKAGSSSGVAGFSSAENFMVTTETPTVAIANPWQQSNRMMVDDSSLRCLFPVEGNEPPAQQLSLSLYNREPSDVAGAGGDHPFDHHLSLNPRDELFSKPTNLQQDGRFFPSPASPTMTTSLYQQPQRMLRSSKYLVPAQELLNEFCSLGGIGSSSKQHKFHKPNKWDEGESSSSSSLSSMDLMELQKRKSRLLSMLEEVDRRYRRYCEQMRAVVSAFEGVAGEGAATVYSTLASKAMSRHFRCLRDGIVGQIQATKKAMGEKDPVTPGATRGETPRLKLLDQCLRQQKAFQQAGVMENHPWRPQRGLPERSVSVLRAWLFEHFLHPYPSDVDKHILSRQTGLSRSQVSNWFINARVRLWKPMVEEMYMEETKEQDNTTSYTTVGHDDNNNSSSIISLHSQLQSNRDLSPNPNPNPSTSQLQAEDQKPAPEQLLHDPDSLSSIINASHRYDHHQQQQQIQRAENFGVVDLQDFSPYNESGNQNNFGNGVSLTLGLQQHNGGGMSLSFSPASQHSLFFSSSSSREGMDDCQPAQFSIVDADQAQNLPYRNLMGAQLLRDLAG